jgi:hypothetical protein
MNGAECLVSQHGFISLEVQGQSFYSRRLDHQDPGPAA